MKRFRIVTDTQAAQIGDIWEGPVFWWICVSALGPLHLRWRAATKVEEKRILARVKKRKVDLDSFPADKVYLAVSFAWLYMRVEEYDCKSTRTLRRKAMARCKSLARGSKYTANEVWNAVYKKAGIMCYDLVTGRLV